MFSKVSWIVLGLLAILATAAAVHVVRDRIATGGTPYWDEASHGLQGLIYAQDQSRLDVRNFIPDVFGHHFRYPPIHGLLLAPNYIVFGNGWLTAVGVSAAIYVVLVLAVFAAACRPLPFRTLQPPIRPGTGLLAAFFVLTSPSWLGQASTIMLELPAGVFAVLVAWFYGASLDDLAPGRMLRVAGWTLTLFALTAAQYATCWIFTVMVFEALRCPAEQRRQAFDWLRRTARSRALFHPVHWIVAGSVLVGLAVYFTGGWRIPLGSRTLSLTAPGGPLTTAILIAGLRIGWLVWRHRAALKASVPPRIQTLFLSLVAPLFVWYFVIYPPRFSHYFDWVASSPPLYPRTSAEYWIYYFRSIVGSVHLSPAIAFGVIAVVVSSFLDRKATERVRFLRFAVACTLGLVLFHTARQQRFILPFLPVWWLLAAETVASAARRIPERLREAAPAAIAVVLALVSIPSLSTLYGPRLHGIVANQFGPASWEAVLRRMSESVEPAPVARVMGCFPGLSIHLVEWQLRQRMDVRGRRLEEDLDNPWRRYPGDPEAGAKTFQDWLAKRPEERVVAVEPIDLETRTLLPAERRGKHDMDWTYEHMRLLRQSPRYRLVGDWPYVDAALRVRAYQRVD